MENLLAQRKPKDLIEEFGNEDLSQWPFWKAGEAYFARGRAYLNAALGEKAEADLQAALELTSDSRTRTSILLCIGRNRETLLKNDAAALDAYRRIVEQKKNTGSADYFRGIQGAAGILTRSGKFNDALAVLRQVEIDKLHGFWRASLFRTLADTLNAADRREEALDAYREVLKETKAAAADRRAAEDAIKAAAEHQ
jgi:tetratricopeptide (TPR) repeat protein